MVDNVQIRAWDDRVDIGRCWNVVITPDILRQITKFLIIIDALHPWAAWYPSESSKAMLMGLAHADSVLNFLADYEVLLDVDKFHESWGAMTR